MRPRLILGSFPALLVAGPALALPNGGPSTEAMPALQPAEVSARRAEPSPSATFLEAAMFTRQDEAAAAPAEAETPAMQAAPKKEPKLHVFVFYETRELSELRVSPDSDNTGNTADFDVFDQDQERVGLGMAFGTNIKGYFKLFGDTFGDSPDDFDGFGGGGGVAGSPSISEINADTNLTLPFRVELTGAFDNTDSQTAGVPGDLVYIENRLEVGVGVNWRGLHPSLGVQVTSTVGYLSDDISNASTTNDYALTGFNPGFYAGVAYKHPEFPMFIDLRFLGGDVSGFAGVLGASF